MTLDHTANVSNVLENKFAKSLAAYFVLVLLLTTFIFRSLVSFFVRFFFSSPSFGHFEYQKLKLNKNVKQSVLTVSSTPMNYSDFQLKIAFSLISRLAECQKLIFINSKNLWIEK